MWNHLYEPSVCFFSFWENVVIRRFRAGLIVNYIYLHKTAASCLISFLCVINDKKKPIFTNF